MSIFKNNTMTLITNQNMIGQEINNKDFVSVATVCSTDYFNNHPNSYDASILMPPTELLMKWADCNDPNMAYLVMQNEYPNYLMYNKDADDMIIALLTALTKKNIILFIPLDEFNIFGQQLLNHFYFMYGITMNTPTTRFSFDETKLPLLLSKFYMMDLMEPMDYLNVYPANLLLPEFVINKLAEQLNPFGNNRATFQQYAQYFNNIVASKANNNVVPMIKKV